MSDSATIRDLGELTGGQMPAGQCDWPGCSEAGKHPAPKSRETLREYYHFCLKHVRAYNSMWNYCDGMAEDDIEREIRNDTCWRRPTWPLGGSVRGGAGSWRIDDPFGAFGDAESDGEAADPAGMPDRRSPEGRAYRTLGLDPPTTLTALKARYKHLVKRLHPDTNGRDKAAEDRLKDINQAYAVLKSHLSG